MDIQEKKAFEIAFDKKLGARGCQFDLDEDGNYEDRETLCGWHMWLEAKAQAVPKGFVFVSKTPSLKVLDRLYAEHDIDEERATYIYRDIIDAQEPAKAQAVPEGFVVCKSEPVAYIVQNKFWKQKFDVKSVKDMPPQKWEDDHYDVEIPLYAVSLDGLVLKEQDEDEAND